MGGLSAGAAGAPGWEAGGVNGPGPVAGAAVAAGALVMGAASIIGGPIAIGGASIIGAPPQFMDFRYSLEDPWHGRFELAHCGALMDVEPMGPDYVRSMCHDIEDPTFDATALATNPYAQVRPIHRPPRVPADRHPVCAWTVIID